MIPSLQAVIAENLLAYPFSKYIDLLKCRCAIERICVIAIAKYVMKSNFRFTNAIAVAMG